MTTPNTSVDIFIESDSEIAVETHSLRFGDGGSSAIRLYIGAGEPTLDKEIETADHLIDALVEYKHNKLRLESARLAGRE